MRLKLFWLIPAGSFGFLFGGALLLGSYYLKFMRRRESSHFKAEAPERVPVAPIER